MTKIVIIREADMLQTAFGAAVAAITPQREGKALKLIAQIVDERFEYEANKERIKNGVLQIAQSPDAEKHLLPLKGNRAFARMVIALNVDARTFLFPQSLDGGKTSEMTSNLKALRKIRQIAEVTCGEGSDLENVAKVAAVCMYHFANNGRGVITREYCKAFLSSYELQHLDQATADLWSAVNEIRGSTVSYDGGAETQSGQMVRALVALGSATDVRDGRHKNVSVNPDGLIMQALMMRLGQINV